MVYCLMIVFVLLRSNNGFADNVKAGHPMSLDVIAHTYLPQIQVSRSDFEQSTYSSQELPTEYERSDLGIVLEILREVSTYP